MRSTFRLGRLFGIDVGIHYTWLLIFALASWSLSVGYFPAAYPGWSNSVYWLTGVVAALLLFASVLVHELAHSLVARAKGLEVASITLFLFGGVASLRREPRQPTSEVLIAVVGPLSTLALAAAFWVLGAPLSAISPVLGAISGYLASINLMLALFNLMPGFPLDGGRVVRGLAWAASGNYLWATRVAATIGQVVGYGFIAAGLLTGFAGGDWLGGIWIAFIGWFMLNAAESSYQMAATRDLFGGARVGQAMDEAFEAIAPDRTLRDLVDGYILAHNRRAVPVFADDELVGLVSLTDVRHVPEPRWASELVVDHMTPREKLVTVRPTDDLHDALDLMQQKDVNQLLVLEDGRLIGVLCRRDVLNFLHLRRELGLLGQPHRRREPELAGERVVAGRR